MTLICSFAAAMLRDVKSKFIFCGARTVRLHLYPSWSSVSLWRHSRTYIIINKAKSVVKIPLLPINLFQHKETCSSPPGPWFVLTSSLDGRNQGARQQRSWTSGAALHVRPVKRELSNTYVPDRTGEQSLCTCLSAEIHSAQRMGFIEIPPLNQPVESCSVMQNFQTVVSRLLLHIQRPRLHQGGYGGLAWILGRPTKTTATSAVPCSAPDWNISAAIGWNLVQIFTVPRGWIPITKQ